MDLPLDAQLQLLNDQKNQAYEERNALVSAISKIWPSHMALHPESDESWERDWMRIVCVHSPVGQLTWHIHDSDRGFDHLNMAPNDWDGHSTEEKYKRLASFCDEVGIHST